MDESELRNTMQHGFAEAKTGQMNGMVIEGKDLVVCFIAFNCKGPMRDSVVEQLKIKHPDVADKLDNVESFRGFGVAKVISEAAGGMLTHNMRLFVIAKCNDGGCDMDFDFNWDAHVAHPKVIATVCSMAANAQDIEARLILKMTTGKENAWVIEAIQKNNDLIDIPCTAIDNRGNTMHSED